MIKYISSETLLYYNEEFHRIINRVIDGLHNAIHIDHMIENPEKDRSDERLISAFERGLDIGYAAPFLIKIPCADVVCTVSPDVLQQFEDAITYVVTDDDEALYVVSFDNMVADYDYSTGTLNIGFRLYCPTRFAKMDLE